MQLNVKKLLEYFAGAKIHLKAGKFKVHLHTIGPAHIRALAEINARHDVNVKRSGTGMTINIEKIPETDVATAEKFWIGLPEKEREAHREKVWPKSVKVLEYYNSVLFTE